MILGSFQSLVHSGWVIATEQCEIYECIFSIPGTPCCSVLDHSRFCLLVMPGWYIRVWPFAAYLSYRGGIMLTAKLDEHTDRVKALSAPSAKLWAPQLPGYLDISSLIYPVSSLLTISGCLALSLPCRVDALCFVPLLSRRLEPDYI